MKIDEKSKRDKEIETAEKDMELLRRLDNCIIRLTLEELNEQETE